MPTLRPAAGNIIRGGGGEGRKKNARENAEPTLTYQDSTRVTQQCVGIDHVAFTLPVGCGCLAGISCTIPVCRNPDADRDQILFRASPDLLCRAACMAVFLVFAGLAVFLLAMWCGTLEITKKQRRR